MATRSGSLAPVLHVEVISAKKLDSNDPDAPPSPYVLISYNGKCKNTDCCSNTARPQWRIGSDRAQFSFRVSSVDKNVRIVVMDYQRVIGTVTINIKTLEENNKPIEDWFDLEPPLSVGNVLLRMTEKKIPTDPGKIHLRLVVEKERVTIDKSPLWLAVKEKSVAIVKSLLKSITFRELNECDEHGDTVLHAAVSRKDWDIPANEILILLLAEERLDVNHCNEDKNTPFHYFCQKYTGPHVFGLLDRFFERGADVHSKNKYGETPLHKAMFNPSLKMSLVDLLLQRGADPNAGAATGETALHYAVRLGREDVVRFLIQKGADFEAESNNNSTPYSIAQSENPAIAELIKDSKDILKWLKRSNLTDYAEDFIANDIFLYTLPDLSEEYLTRVLPESADCTKVMIAVKRFTMEVGSFKPKLQEQKKKEQFLQQLALRRRESILRKSLNQQMFKRLANSVLSDTSGGLGSVAGIESSSSLPKLTTQDSVALLRRKVTTNTLRIHLDKTKVEAEATRVLREGSHVGSTLFEHVSRSPSWSKKTELPRQSTELGLALLAGDGSSGSPKRPKSPRCAPVETTTVPATHASDSPIPQHLSWEIDPLDVHYERVLGHGGSGEVWLARYQGMAVAVKILHQTATDAELREFKKEFQVLISLSSPYIIKFFGAVVHSKRALVMEFCSRGSLFDVMRAPNVMFDWDLFFSVATDIVHAIAELHNRKPEILHRDVKSLNLLVTDDFHVKICDFGLSRFNTGSNLATLSRCRGTFAYVAPEIYDCEVFTTKSDIYALGIVLWELVFRVITGEYQRPYKEYAFIRMDFQTLVMARKKDLRPTIPSLTPSKLSDLIQACWDPVPAKRLDASEICEALQEIQEDYRSRKKKWDNILVQFALQNHQPALGDSSQDASPTMSQTTLSSKSLRAQSSMRSRRDSVWRTMGMQNRLALKAPSPVVLEGRRDSAPPSLESNPISTNLSLIPTKTTAPKSPKQGKNSPSTEKKRTAPENCDSVTMASNSSIIFGDSIS